MATNYDKQRRKVNPPHAPLVAVRKALGLKQAEVVAAVGAILGRKFTAGGLSAIESGTRGASPEVLAAIETALGLRAGDLVVDYQPSHSRRPAGKEEKAA